jgi:hypothetical protein
LVSAANNVSIEIPLLTWARLVFDLRKRGRGNRESGAFLLGLTDGTCLRVRDYVCYDDVDPHAYQGGAIVFHAVGHAALSQHCKTKKMDVLADIHTHPFGDVRQSIIDQRHPMLPLAGHTAMIMPHFGRTPWWSLSGVGIYEYLGNLRWRVSTHDAPPRVRLTLW